MPFFSKVFKSKDPSTKRPAAQVANGNVTKKPQWSDAWIRTRVDPDEVAELLHLCTAELKSRALDVPFLLLPFRPSSDPSAARTFVRNYFFPPNEREQLQGAELANELKMTEVMVLISVMKWCWARLPGGVVTWETYEMFKVGEKDTGSARDSFTTFVPISVESNARLEIIKDFFDLMAAIAARGKSNGLGGHKLSRYAGWWAFEHYDTGKGFEAGYKSWEAAANATSHLFFAYLRSLSPEPGKNNGILSLPRSLQQLVEATSYPPTEGLISNDTTKVVMIVDVVSPTPHALLRRAKNFEYRDDDAALQQFANYEDPVQSLTDECRRVLKAISSTNQSTASSSKTSTSLSDPSWSRFEDIGFGSTIDENEEEEESILGPKRHVTKGLTPSRTYYEDLARPTTPSWADFLSTGFTDDNAGKSSAPMLLPPDKILPPINTVTRGQSSQSHRRNHDFQPNLDPGELASITTIQIDDAFWWVWISSLAGEEPTSRKAVFGRCALLETVIPDGHWMIMEEQVKGAAPEPAAGAYIAEKKKFLGFTTKRGRLTRRRSGVKKSGLSEDPYSASYDTSRATLAPDQQAKIHQAAAELTRKKQATAAANTSNGVKNNLTVDSTQANRNSIYSLGPVVKDEASPAMKWASQYDKKAIRAKYLGDDLAGKGSRELLTLPTNGSGVNRSNSTLSIYREKKELPEPPKEEEPVVVEKIPEIVEPIPPVEVVEPAPLPVESEKPVEQSIAVEAAKIPVPPTDPEPMETVPPVQQQQPPRNSAKLRKSLDGHRRSPEQKKLKTKGPTSHPPPVQKPGGVRRLFGTMRSKSREPEARQPPKSPVESNPAIAAARRALEGKPALPGNGPNSPPLSPGHFNRFKPAKSPVTKVEQVPETTPAVAEAPEVVPATDAVPEPVEESVPKAVTAENTSVGPPRTRRDEEYDKLSRVDTNEKEHAEREFSTFDQGPLLDQPAFVPEDSPVEKFPAPHEDPTYQPPSRPKHESTYSAMSMESVASEDDDLSGNKPSYSTGDRWAQIRRNAAERAARQSEEHTTRSRTETRTDDGETSGEETIESRVARIKARVAELTGNMEATRR